MQVGEVAGELTDVAAEHGDPRRAAEPGKASSGASAQRSAPARSRRSGEVELLTAGLAEQAEQEQRLLEAELAVEVADLQTASRCIDRRGAGSRALNALVS